MDILFRQAQENELEEIYHIFVLAIESMIQHNIFQWDELYPDKEILKQDIKKKQLYIGLSNKKIVCAYVLNQECDEQYNNGNWQYPEAQYCVIHRLCVNPEAQNKGIGTLTMEYIEKEVIKAGVSSIRLDAFTQNPYAIQLYKKLDYHVVGYADWRKGRFCLMEKRLG